MLPAPAKCRGSLGYPGLQMVCCKGPTCRKAGSWCSCCRARRCHGQHVRLVGLIQHCIVMYDV